MTVDELISKLSKLDPTKVVVLADDIEGHGFHNITVVAHATPDFVIIWPGGQGVDVGDEILSHSAKK